MIKQDIFNKDVKARFLASARDRMYRFVMANDCIKGAIVNTGRMVNEMRANHGTDPLQTLVLGQAYIAAALMSSTLKGKDRISLNIGCSGPVKGLDVEANVFGEVRGFLKTRQLLIPDPKQIRSLSSLFGAGFLTITKYLEDAAVPYSGQIALEYGSIAEDLANYFLVSEQIPTGFNLSIFFDENEEVKGAGGIFLQAMPGADPDKVVEAEKIMGQIKSLGRSFSEKILPEELVKQEFSSLKPRFVGNSRVEFFCRCSQKRMEGHLKNMPAKEKLDILKNGPFPLELCCHHCNSVYVFTRENIETCLG